MNDVKTLGVKLVIDGLNKLSQSKTHTHTPHFCIVTNTTRTETLERKPIFILKKQGLFSRTEKPRKPAKCSKSGSGTREQYIDFIPNTLITHTNHTTDYVKSIVQTTRECSSKRQENVSYKQEKVSENSGKETDLDVRTWN